MASVCPECKSTMLTKEGFAIRARKKVQRYRCKKCLWIGTRLGRSGQPRGNGSKHTVNGNTVVLDIEDE